MDLSNPPSRAFLESERLASLEALAILDTPPEREFDDLARLAAIALGVESAAISLIDHRRQWFKARHGIPFAETSREIAFCDHAVRAREMLVVLDAAADAQFSENPLVTCQNGIRFYAGTPLFAHGGQCLGTFCVFDPQPRSEMTEAQRATLMDLARLASDLLASRSDRRMGEIAAKVAEATTDGVIAADSGGKIVYWNAAAARMFGRSRGEVIGRGLDVIIPECFASNYAIRYANAGCEEGAWMHDRPIELVASRADGAELPVELTLAEWGEFGSERGIAAIVRDVSKRKLLEREREHSKAFLDTIVCNLPGMLFVKDAETRRYLMVNKAGEALTGRSAAQMIGSTDRELFPQYGRGYEQRDMAAVLAGSPQVYESVFRQDDGTPVHLRTTRTLIDGPDRPGQFLLGVSEDVTEVRQAEHDVKQLAHYDMLTGLLNRTSFTERLHRLVEHKAPFALLSVDLDRFKAINDQFGHLVGDEVLMLVADRLRAIAAPSDWVARIGGDEFALVLLGGELRERARIVAKAAVASLSDAYCTDRAVAHAGASVGVVVYPDDASTAEQIRESVDMALYRAKLQGRGTACFFNAEMDLAARDRRRLENELRFAVETGEIGLAYQPILSARTGQMTSVEALARWNHIELGPIPPDIFIPLAEESGLIDALGAQLLRLACQDAMAWPGQLRVAVNLSPLQFLSGKLMETVRTVLDETGLPAGRLQLEVTEGLVIRDVERTFAQLESLRAMGIRILIDDFGVGYSSLSYFQRFPFDKVKVDRSFVKDITHSREAKAIIQAVAGLGSSLDMAVVAEGVETEEQMRLLVEIGCTHLQGYLFSHPISAQQVCSFAIGKAFQVREPGSGSQSLPE